MHVNLAKLAATTTLAVVCTACSPLSEVSEVGVRPFYKKVALPAEAPDILVNQAYRTDADSDPVKHRLDLYRPSTNNWPLLVFVHGGSLVKGDKDLRVGGFDIYGNIGRFYSSRGIGVAVVNYRLQPEVRWPEQADDLAAALAWLNGELSELGGDGRIFVSGHSAGAWLAARVVVDRERLASFDLEPERFAGVITVSGSGFQMTDDQTWQMSGREDTWAERFDPGNPELDWKVVASVVPLLEPGTPPFLLIHSTREWAALVRQNRLFQKALEKAGIPNELVPVENRGHRRTVLAMSHADKLVAAEILDFIHGPRAMELFVKTES